jgi:hypothetical protein
MSMLSNLIKKFVAAFRKKVPGWLTEIAYAAVRAVEIASRKDGTKNETKRAAALEMMKDMIEDIGKEAKQSAINLALEMAVNALGFKDDKEKEAAPVVEPGEDQ